MLKIYISDGIQEKLNGSPSSVVTWDKFLTKSHNLNIFYMMRQI